MERIQDSSVRYCAEVKGCAVYASQVCCSFRSCPRPDPAARIAKPIQSSTRGSVLEPAKNKYIPGPGLLSDRPCHTFLDFRQTMLKSKHPYLIRQKLEMSFRLRKNKHPLHLSVLTPGTTHKIIPRIQDNLILHSYNS